MTKGRSQWPWAWIMIKPDSMGSCLETKNKLHTVSFFLSFLKSSLILYSPVSGASSCVVAWSMELLWMWVGYSFTGSHSDHIRYSHYYQDFLGKHNNHSYHTNHTLFSFNWSMIDKWLWLTTHHCIFPFGWQIYFWDLITTVSDNNQVMNLKYVVGVTLEKSRGRDKQDNFFYPVIQ